MDMTFKAGPIGYQHKEYALHYKGIVVREEKVQKVYTCRCRNE